MRATKPDRALMRGGGIERGTVARRIARMSMHGELFAGAGKKLWGGISLCKVLT